MCAIFVTLFVFLIHLKVKRRVGKLTIEKNSKVIMRVFKWISILFLAEERVYAKLVNWTFEFLLIQKIRHLFKIESTLDCAVKNF